MLQNYKANIHECCIQNGEPGIGQAITLEWAIKEPSRALSDTIPILGVNNFDEANHRLLVL